MRSGVQFLNAAGGSNLKCRFHKRIAASAPHLAVPDRMAVFERPTLLIAKGSRFSNNLAHTDLALAPKYLTFFSADIPGGAIVDLNPFPSGWDKDPHGNASMDGSDAFLERGRPPRCALPSVILLCGGASRLCIWPNKL